jgi:hypothetical protein
MNMEKEKNILKRTDPQIVFFTINKEINLILDSNDIRIKKESIENLYNFIVNEKPALKAELIQEILISFNKNLIKIALFDQLEKCREYSIKLLI